MNPFCFTRESAKLLYRKYVDCCKASMSPWDESDTAAQVCLHAALYAQNGATWYRDNIYAKFSGSMVNRWLGREGEN